MPLYKQDPNDSKKQVPNIQGTNRRDRVSIPTQYTFNKTPSYVLVNTLMTTPCAFSFGDTTLFDANVTSQSVSAGITFAQSSSFYTKVGDDLPAGTKLNIHPTAWSGSAADVGKVTFVYKSGLSTGGF